MQNCCHRNSQRASCVCSTPNLEHSRSSLIQTCFFFSGFLCTVFPTIQLFSRKEAGKVSAVGSVLSKTTECTIVQPGTKLWNGCERSWISQCYLCVFFGAFSNLQIVANALGNCTAPDVNWKCPFWAPSLIQVPWVGSCPWCLLFSDSCSLRSDVLGPSWWWCSDAAEPSGDDVLWLAWNEWEPTQSVVARRVTACVPDGFPHPESMLSVVFGKTWQKKIDGVVSHVSCNVCCLGGTSISLKGDQRMQTRQGDFASWGSMTKKPWTPDAASWNSPVRVKQKVSNFFGLSSRSVQV